MYIKEKVLSIYLSLDRIMKAEEPMIFYDHLIFSLVFSKLQGSCQNDNAQIRTGTNRKIGIMIIWICYSALSNPIVCVAAKFSDLSFSSTSHRDLKKTLVTQIRAMAFLILSSLKRNPVLKGLSKALYLSTASTVRVMEGTIAKVVMRAHALQTKCPKFSSSTLCWLKAN